MLPKMNGFSEVGMVGKPGKRSSLHQGQPKPKVSSNYNKRPTYLRTVELVLDEYVAAEKDEPIATIDEGSCRPHFPWLGISKWEDDISCSKDNSTMYAHLTNSCWTFTWSSSRAKTTIMLQSRPPFGSRKVWSTHVLVWPDVQNRDPPVVSKWWRRFCCRTW